MPSSRASFERSRHHEPTRVELVTGEQTNYNQGYPRLDQTLRTLFAGPLTPRLLTMSRATNPYDDVQYESFPFPQSHPDRMATIATLAGLRVPNLASARVLELGCSEGGNILPMAEEFPNATFVGVDSSHRAIDAAQNIVDILDLKNITLLHRDISEVDRSIGEFDFIIAHGVFSWVPRRLQDHILTICSNHLSPTGVAYISYNTNPGWRIRGIARDAMRFRASSFESSGDKIREAKSFLSIIVESMSEDSPFKPLLRAELQHVTSKRDWYVFHEYLADTNEAEYFSEFITRAMGHGLQYIGEADFSTMSTTSLSPDVEFAINENAFDIIQAEQFMDFIRNRPFRQTLLCHSHVVLSRTLYAEKVTQLFIRSCATPEMMPDTLRTYEKVVFRKNKGTLTTADPLVKCAMTYLRSIWPKAVGFRDLVTEARYILNSGPILLDPADDVKDVANVASTIIKCYSAGIVDLHIRPGRVEGEVSKQPTATRLARYQAERSTSVTNLWHDVTPVTNMERHVLRLLDGRADIACIVDRLHTDAIDGRLLVEDGGRRIKCEEKIRDILTNVTQKSLGSLLKKALLLSSQV